MPPTPTLQDLLATSTSPLLDLSSRANLLTLFCVYPLSGTSLECNPKGKGVVSSLTRTPIRQCIISLIYIGGKSYHAINKYYERIWARTHKSLRYAHDENTTPIVFAQKREWTIYLVPELLVVAAK